MPSRGFAIDVPSWWMDDLAEAMKNGSLQAVDLAKWFVDPELEKRGGKPYEAALGAAQVKVMRFIKGEKVKGQAERKLTRTADMVDVFVERLGLLPLVFFAETRDDAKTMAMAMSDSREFMRVARVREIEAKMSEEDEAAQRAQTSSSAGGERHDFDEALDEAVREIEAAGEIFGNLGQPRSISSSTDGSEGERQTRKVVPPRPKDRRG